MVFAAPILALLFAVPPDMLQEQPKYGPNDRKVTVKEAWFLKTPSRLAETFRKAEDGEDVTILEAAGKYSKVTVKKENATAFIHGAALIAPEKFSRSAADEKEGQKLAAQGLEGQKGLNPDTEKEYRSLGGPSRDQAYRDLDAWMTRPSYKGDRAALEARLKTFREEGKLGEFSSVK